MCSLLFSGAGCGQRSRKKVARLAGLVQKFHRLKSPFSSPSTVISLDNSKPDQVAAAILNLKILPHRVQICYQTADITQMRCEPFFQANLMSLAISYLIIIVYRANNVLLAQLTRERNVSFSAPKRNKKQQF